MNAPGCPNSCQATPELVATVTEPHAIARHYRCPSCGASLILRRDPTTTDAIATTPIAPVTSTRARARSR